MNVSVDVWASSIALESESFVRPPCLIVSLIDVSDDVHVVIAEQSPSAHSLVGVVSLLELSLEPQPAARAADGHGDGDQGRFDIGAA